MKKFVIKEYFTWKSFNFWLSFEYTVVESGAKEWRC